jgi:hypothetical protein
MAKQYVVKALAALVNVEDGISRLLHRGAPLPENVDKAQLQHLIDNDLVEEGEPVGGLQPVTTGDGQTVVTSPAEPVAKPGPAPKASAKAAAVDSGQDAAKADG